MARLFDGRNAAGDWTFAPDRQRIDDPAERARIARFLGSGRVIIRMSGGDVDRLDPDAGDVVPLSTLTDGVWIWGAALQYYVEHHGIAPEPEFLAHMAACEYVAVQPDEAARREALAVLRGER